jgi:hypothetical protein
MGGESFWAQWRRGALVYLLVIASFVAVIVPFALIEAAVATVALSAADERALLERIGTPFTMVAILIFGPYLASRLVRRFVRLPAAQSSPPGR